MAITTVSSVIKAISGSGAQTINKPTGVTTGDLLILAMGIDVAAVNTVTPTGFTTVSSASTSDTTNGCVVSVYYKLAGGAEPTTYGWTPGAFGFGAAGIIAYRGCDGTTPVLGSSTAGTGTASATPSTGITSWTGAATTCSVLIGGWISNTAAAANWNTTYNGIPAGWDFASNGFIEADGGNVAPSTGGYVVCAANLTPSSGVTSRSTQSITPSTGGVGFALQMALQVAGSGGTLHTSSQAGTATLTGAQSKQINKLLLA